MSEFEKMSDDMLKNFRRNMKSYLQGCEDFFKITEDTYKKTKDLYKNKIFEIDKELMKRSI